MSSRPLNRSWHCSSSGWGCKRTRVVEVKRIVTVAPDQCFEDAAYGEFQFGIANLDIGVDNGFGSPLASHRVQETLNAHLATKRVVETDVCISSVSGGIDIRVEGGSKSGAGGIVLSKGVEGDAFVH